MKLFMCFGGAVPAVIDDEAAEVAARHLHGQRRRGGRRSLSFRGKSSFLLPGKKPSDKSKKQGMDADDEGVYGVSRASAVLLSPALSLDSSDTSASSSSSSRSSTASSSPSVSGMLCAPPFKRRQAKRPASSSSPAAGAAAVVLCLLMVVLCGRVGATLLTSMALYLFPRRWPATTTTTTREAEKRGGAAVDSLECDAAASSASEAEEEATAIRRRGRWLRRGPR